VYTIGKLLSAFTDDNQNIPHKNSIGLKPDKITIELFVLIHFLYPILCDGVKAKVNMSL
jgi:hypothetical protein